MNINAVTITETQRINAAHRLAFARQQHPELSLRLDEAKVELTAAIMAMDEADVTTTEAQRANTVQIMTQRYTQALADLVHGKACADITPTTTSH